MVKDVEPLRPKLHLHFFAWLEDLIHRHIEVRAMRHIETVPARVAEGQALGLRKSGAVEKRESLDIGNVTAGVGVRVRIANLVGVRAVARNPVGHAGVVAENAVNHRKRSAALRGHYAGILPSSQESVGKSFAPEVGLFVDPGHSQNLPLIEVGSWHSCWECRKSSRNSHPWRRMNRRASGCRCRPRSA